MTKCTCIYGPGPSGRMVVVVPDPECPGAHVHARTVVRHA